MSTTSTALNVAGHAVDLDDGRVLAPEESAEIDANKPHNRALVVGGLLHITEGLNPQVSKPERLVKDAEKDAIRTPDNSRKDRRS